MLPPHMERTFDFKKWMETLARGCGSASFKNPTLHRVEGKSRVIPEAESATVSLTPLIRCH